MLEKIAAGHVAFEAQTIPLAAFPGLVDKHLAAVHETRELEHEAAILAAEGFNEPDLEPFIRRVCRWGGYVGLAGRIVKQNPTSTIRQQFLSALRMLDEDPPDVQGALQEVNLIRQLGRPSFASKHLRFFRPDLCPVLDNIIAQRLQYEYDSGGYRQFSQDCLRVAEALQARGLENPMNREDGRWFAADVEMALFAFLYHPPG
jgi:hypothetical protein